MIKNLYKNLITTFFILNAMQISLFANDINIDVIAKEPINANR